jgi:cytochrome b6-f complex iron-sulfur subunit
VALALLIAVPILFIAAVVAIFSLGRRNANTGSLSRETLRSDRSEEGIPDDMRRGKQSGESGRAVTTGASVPATRGAGVPAQRTPATDEELGLSRRQFFGWGVFGAMALAVGSLGAGVLAFLWPSGSGGFGGKIPAGASLADMLAYNTDKKQPFYIPEARAYIVPYPKADLPKAKKVYAPVIYSGMQQGVVALYQKCVHLGCRVPFCDTSQWFECPCHGSKYNRVGEKRDGPAPRGLDRFQVLVSGGSVTVNTGLLSVGPPIGTNTTGQVAEGPHCVG